MALDVATPSDTHLNPHKHRGRRLNHFFEATADRVPTAIAVEDGPLQLSYRELDRRANQLAHRLRTQGLQPDSRIGILLQRSTLTYVSLLGVLKAGAAFVPIDPASPPDRVRYIAEDADIDLLISTSDLLEELDDFNRPTFPIDTMGEAISAAPNSRPTLPEPDGDPTCYVIYTSGSSGRPKGVQVTQSSICNFIDVVPSIYDVRQSDRVYQGMTISFDFSIEEIWPTWAVGATLVVGPTDARRLGADLADFLDQKGVTVLYCVPTLLATITRDLPRVRSLLVGGEACPAGLVERWSKPQRRMLNTYGPTEATVTATWCELLPGKVVTIGRPLPTYSVVLLDEQRQPVPDGEVGEICIGGPGVAKGYVGRPELTADRFIEHPLAPEGTRLYRTGDLGRITDTGDIEYLGRADAEVKIRGHRVDLGEIDNVLLDDPEVGSAVAALVKVSESGKELAAYVVRRPDRPGNHVGEEALVARLHETLRRRVPDYMVPVYIDVVDELPMMPSGKVDRNRLPAPTGRRLLAGGPIVPPATELEERIAAVWAEVFGLRLDELSVEANFFTDLGGHSLLAATVVSLLRERGIGRRPAIRQLYANPTVRALAGHLEVESALAEVATGPDLAPLVGFRQSKVALAGTVQAAFLLVLLGLATLPAAIIYSYHDGDVSFPMLGQLAIAATVAYLGVRWVLPVLLARPLAAGIKPGRYPLWGLVYLRLWALDVMLSISPLVVLSGSPLLQPYLRLLGARIGRRCHIGTSAISMPTMVVVEQDVAIGYGTQIRPWVVSSGWVVVEPVMVRSGAFVGSSCVLEPGAFIGQVAAIADHSAVATGQTIPPGEWWGGSPCVPRKDPSPMVDTMVQMPAAPGWRMRHVAMMFAGLVYLELLPILMIAPSVALVWWVMLTYGLTLGLVATVLIGPVFVATVCVFVALSKRIVLPRTPTGIHRQRSGLGVRKWIADKLLEISLALTNSLYATLYTVPWLRVLGARVGRGAEVSTAAHLDPDLLTLKPECFVADMASIGCATFYNGRIGFATTEVGRRAFVGNAAHVPAGVRMGDGSLVGVHTVPPQNGVPPDTSWLGSPPLYLPRRQDSGSFSDELTFRPRKRAVLGRLTIEFFRATLPASVLAVSVYLYLLMLSQIADATDLLETVVLAPLPAVLAALGVLFFVVGVKWNIVGAYRPRVEPMWSKFVRRSEFVTGLYEAAAVPALLHYLVGTPFIAPALRLLGARIGRRAWIGTTYVTEFDLVDIGDEATVGQGASLQTHLFEDRVMKMSDVRVGEAATVGVRAIVLYDSVVGSRAVLDSLSLLMKGEQLSPGTRWRGIPAQGVT